MRKQSHYEIGLKNNCAIGKRKTGSAGYRPLHVRQNNSVQKGQGIGYGPMDFTARNILLRSPQNTSRRTRFAEEVLGSTTFTYTDKLRLVTTNK
jgi:hypothetical protein